jgi:hypothetical protein
MSVAVRDKKSHVLWLENWSGDLGRYNAKNVSFDERHLWRACVVGLFWDLGPPENDED